MKNFKAILTALFLLSAVAVNADASSSHFYDPAYPGHGVAKTFDSGQGSAYTWYLYDRAGEPTWLITLENCAEYPCTTELGMAAGTWMGGDVELISIGEVTIDFAGDMLIWDYDVKAWPKSGDCGRLLQVIENQCIGTFEMEAID